MNIAICDDSTEYLDRIEQLLEPYIEANYLKISRFTSGEEFLDSINKDHIYDIIFLDIEMAQISGLEAARKIREKESNSIIIFITSHISYVSDTFRLSAFQFLLKPIDEAAFRLDFERALQEYKSRHEQYVVRWRDVYCVLEYEEIFYIEAYNRHLFIHTETEGYECVGKLTEDSEKLKPYHFARCHQGYLVNLNKIKRINKASIKLKNEKEVPISRRYRAGVMEAFNLYLAGRKI
jgi:DNA-binding LytR/AlgR family response regulator